VVYFKIASDRVAYVEAERLARRVFGELSNYASSMDDSFVSVTQMRDSVLRDEFSSVRRQRVWRNVEKLVEQNSNVRTKVGSLGSGDIGRGWRWIGSERPAGSGRRSSMYSRGFEDSSPGMEEANGVGVTPSARGSEMSDFRRWRDHDEPKF
jgi:Man1-Src1p-C-terminal domain